MIATLFGFLVISMIFVVFGKGFVLYFDKTNASNYSLADAFFIGLCVVGTWLNIWSIFFPTNNTAFVFLVIGTVLLLSVQRKIFIGTFKIYYQKIANAKIFGLFILAAIGIVLLYGVVTPKLYDSYLYHVNAIQWNTLYRAVPGLANFHDRFGFNSSVFVLSAGFSLISIFGQYLFLISSLSFLVFFIWLLQEIYFRKGISGLFFLLFLYYFTYQYTLDISSPGTDLLPNIIIGFLLLSLLFHKDAVKSRSLVFIILPLFCLTLKLSTLPIALISVFALYQKRNNYFHLGKTLAMYGAFILLPWLVRNVILTGYLIYPIYTVDLFDFDWEVSKASIVDIQKWIYSWARIPMRDHDEVLAMSFGTWFPIWWKAATNTNKVLFILAASSPAWVGMYAFLKRKKENLSSLLLVFIVSYSSFVLWVFTAPDFRFSFSFILALALVPLLLLSGLELKVQKVFSPVLLLGMAYCMVDLGQDGYRLFSGEYLISKTAGYLYAPTNVSYLKSRRNIRFKTLTLNTKGNIPVNFYGPSIDRSQCFDKFPCTWYIDERFKMRGEDLQDGFQRKPF